GHTRLVSDWSSDVCSSDLCKTCGSWLLTKGFNMSYTLHCERATLDFDLARGSEAMQVTEEGKAPRTISYDGPDGYGGEVRYAVGIGRASCRERADSAGVGG